ncbi:MAG: hypothetical protein WDN28_20025 [Chthoniobacter sp.]
MKTRPNPLDQIAAAPSLAAKLARVREGEAVSFEHVVDAAQPFLAALLVQQAKARVWVVCPNVRAQETMHNELLQWFPDALFFPELDRSSVEGALADPESVAERLGIVQRLTSAKGRQVVVLTRGSLDDKVPTAAALQQLEIRLRRSAKLDREKLLKQLTEAGYEHVPQVSARGQYAVRGGILDVFSFHHSLPVRIELFDDEIESLREFDLDSQISVQHLDSVTLLLGETAAERSTCQLSEIIAERDLTIDAEASWFAAQVRIMEHSEGNITEGAEDYTTAFYDHGLGEFEAGDFVVDEIKRERFFTQLREWRTDGWRVHVYCNNEGEIERLHDLLPPVEADALHAIHRGHAQSRLHFPRRERSRC